MKTGIFFALFFCIGVASTSAQGIPPPMTWGLIFNTDNLLSNLESYQAGIGIKLITTNTSALRLLVDCYYSDSLNTFSSTLGVAYENHFLPGKISPYWGGFIQAGYLSQKTEQDSANWTKDDSVPLSGGLILGVEFFVLENVSLFAEYEADFTETIKYTTTDVAGNETRASPQFNFYFDLGIGNDAKLGITIYLGNLPKKSKK
jgi:hypothetical protein